MTHPKLPPGPFTIAQLAELGMTRSELRSLLDDGVVRRMSIGVYVDADVEETFDLRASAIALITRAHQIVCDRAAAWLWGIDVFPYADLDLLPIETCALRGKGPCRRSEVDGRTRDLLPSDVTDVHGVRVTTPLRTALDLGCLLERKDALAALDGFRRRFGITIAELTAGAARFRRRRGVVQLKELIPLSDPRAESARESWTRLAISDEGLLAPEPQVWIEIDGVPTYRLDFAYRRRRIAVEYDGWDSHRRTRKQRERDEARRTWLREHGWTVIVIRVGDFTEPGLSRWLGELKDALASSYDNRRRLERGARQRR